MHPVDKLCGWKPTSARCPPTPLGIEDEFQLVNPASRELVPAIDALLAVRDAAKLPADSVASELSASCMEMSSPIYDTVAELATELPALRRRVRDLAEGCGIRLATAGYSPFWAGSDTRLSSVRVKIFNLVPRSGLPHRFRSWEDFDGYVDALVGAGSIPDPSLC